MPALRLLAPLLLAASAAPADAIDDAVRGLIERKTFAGAVTLVERDGEIVHFSAHGEAAPGVPMKKDAVFRIYSMTKPVTAVAALLLVEEGKIELDAPVGKYVKVLAGSKVVGGGAPKRAVSVRDLFRHTSGFTYGRGDGAVAQAFREAKVGGARDLGEMMERLAKVPLAFEPGTKWHYGVSTDVLGAVVEAASGKTLDVFFRERVFAPLGMKDTGFFVREGQRARFTANYGARMNVIDAPGTSRFLKKPAMLSGGGGLVSTAEDYRKFCSMILRGGEPLLKPATVAEMMRNQLADKMLPIRFGRIPLSGTGFGLGAAVKMAADMPGTKGEFHWGGAASTNFSIVPERKLIVITMAQRMPMNPLLHVAVRPAALRLGDGPRGE